MYQAQYLILQSSQAAVRIKLLTSVTLYKNYIKNSALIITIINLISSMQLI